MWIRIRTETTVDLKTPIEQPNKKFQSKYYEVRPEPWVVRFQQFPKPPWNVVDPERGVAVVGRLWGAVGTAVDPEMGGATVGEMVGLWWEAAVGTAVVPPTRWS